MDPLTAAASLAPLVIGAFRRPSKGPNRYAIVQRYRNSKPVGYTSPEDEAAAERARLRIAGAAKAVATNRRATNARQVTQRGLGGPAAAALEEEATQTEAAGAEEGARTSADLLYKAFQSNLGYERNKNDTAFGAELGVATHDAAMADAQNASFWNSALEAIPGIASAWSPRTTSNVAPVSTPAGASPAAPEALGEQTQVSPVNTVGARRVARSAAGYR